MGDPVKIDWPGQKLDNKPGADFNLYNNAYNNKMPTAYVPNEDPNIQSSLNSQIASAKKYRDSIPQQSDKMFGQYQGQARRGLAETMKGVDRDYNRRGLLHSGLREGGQYDAISKYQNDLNETRGNINSGLLGNADTMESNAYNTAAAKAGLGYNIGDALVSGAQTDLDRQSANAKANQDVWKSVFSNAGTLAGTMAKSGKTADSSYDGGSGTAYGKQFYQF